MSAEPEKPVRTVNCPTCATPVPWGPQSPFRPFCSERCRQIDLGAWASDAYRVAGDAPEEGDTLDPPNSDSR
ncbi:MAG TPA: DNA gyrase inhibitor YacG [Rhodocyclaceae bacterium]|nr:DNA gyrase inhibitor YacG [Rhodocyclaceae bacterium]